MKTLYCADLQNQLKTLIASFQELALISNRLIIVFATNNLNQYSEAKSCILLLILLSTCEEIAFFFIIPKHDC